MDVCKRYLVSKRISMPDEWISACIEFIQSEELDRSNANNLNLLKEKVYEQWLHTDLTEIGTQCFPNGINNQKTILDGNFAVQINSVKDVGLPAYNQLQKLKKSNTENTNVSADKTFQSAWEPKPSRMLWMEVTDGTNVVKCMEYKPIPLLSLSMKPGSKVLLSGKMECRKGTLLLKAENVKFLGGEVDSLLTPNAMENILSLALGLPTTEAPAKLEDVSCLSSTIDMTQSQYYSTQQSQVTQKLGNSNPTDMQNKNKFPKNSSNGNSYKKQIIQVDDFDMDDDLIDAEFEQELARVESQASNFSRPRNTSNKKSNFASDNDERMLPCRKTNMDDDFDDEFDDDLILPLDITSVSNIPRNSNVKNSNKSSGNFLNSKHSFCPFNDSIGAAGNSPRTFNKSKQGLNNFRGANKLHSSSNESKFGNSSRPIGTISSGAKSSSNVDEFEEFDEEASFDQDEMELAMEIGEPDLDLIDHNFEEFHKTDKINPTQNSPLIDSGIGTTNKILRQVNRVSDNNTPSASTLNCPGPSNEKDGTSVNSNFDMLTDFDDLEDDTLNSNFDSNRFILNLENMPPFTYLCLVDMKPVKMTTVRVKGFILTLLTRLSKNAEGWTLAAKIGDGTMACDVLIHNAVLQKLIGLSKEEMDVEREKAKADPTIRAMITERLIKCQQRLISISCIFVLQIFPGENRPTLKEYIEIDRTHLDQMKKRNS